MGGLGGGEKEILRPVHYRDYHRGTGQNTYPESLFFNIQESSTRKHRVYQVPKEGINS